jgi:ribosomal protein L11 methyltransferase
MEGAGGYMTNPFAQSEMLYEMVFTDIEEANVPALEESFADLAQSLTSFETDAAKKFWKTTLYLTEKPDHADIVSRLGILKAMTGIEIAEPTINNVETKDWVEEVNRSFPPLAIGPYYIHGSHVEETPPANTTSLLVEANAAFGTGEHATTQGCLMALEDICKKEVPTHALDMGCGSAILAMALAKRHNVPVLGVEIDAVSVGVAHENVRINQLRDLVDIREGNGFQLPEVTKRGPYPLIIANILARPLTSMAPGMKQQLAGNGSVILSGLLDRQERYVLSAYAYQGLFLHKRYAIGEWHTLLLK